MSSKPGDEDQKQEEQKGTSEPLEEGASGGSLSPSPELEEALVQRESGAFGNRGLIRTYLQVQDQLEGALAKGDLQVGNATIDDILVSLTGGK